MCYYIQAAAAAAEAKEAGSFKLEDADRDQLRRVFERAERDKRKERERNVKRQEKSGAGTAGDAGRVAAVDSR